MTSAQLHFPEDDGEYCSNCTVGTELDLSASWAPRSLCSTTCMFLSLHSSVILWTLPGGLKDFLTLTGRTFPGGVKDSQAFSRELALEGTQFLFSHYFDSEFLQIEDSGAGLGNFLASCNALSLNWFYQDNYLKSLDCSRRQA